MSDPPEPPVADGAAAPPAAPRLAPGLTFSERVRFPEALPISARAIDIANAVHRHQVVIVAGETGSGKTTQLPKICLAMGRGTRGYIGCTQPRRLAATSVAARVAEELETELGDVVGYKIRFNDRIKPDSYVKFMTDGILLAEIHGDPELRGYDTLIIDEAHERSLNIDFLLGYVKRLLPRRPDLRVIISSATLATERFSAFFDGAPVIEVSGRTYPVDVLYRPPREDEADLVDAVANAVNEICELDARGDILVFLPGEREIREAQGELSQRALPHTTVLPLYARLTAAEQQKVFQRATGRRVVLATNVAETSLTIPGIIYVVDAGVARINRYSVRTGVTQLLIEPVSRASADQRKGRCGRTANGICFRLYEERDYLSRPAYTDPEIRRVGLAGVILRMKTLGLGAVESFPFLDPPDRRAVDEGYRVLEELGALDDDGQLTAIGRELGALPVDPRLGRIILGGRDHGAVREVLVIAAALGLQDPRERPQAAQQKADEAHRPFRDEGSDFAGYLKLWAYWKEARGSKRQISRLCRDTFLSYVRMREWEDVHDQLTRVVKDLGITPNSQPASAEQLHKALLPGLLSKIGVWNPEARHYVGARQIRFMVHPSSALARKPPAWVVAAELVETSQLFARTVAKIDPAWIEAAAGDLCKRSHHDPHWEQKQAQVMAREQVTLFGLPIVKNRSVAYAPYDPAACRELFITHALVRHEYTSKGPFMAHNARVLAQAQQARDKARRSDMMADEYALAEFFDARLPADVHSGKTFEDWRRAAERTDPTILFLKLDDILLDDARALGPAQFPDQLTIGGTRVPLTYRFEPSEDDDGVTATVPLALLPQLDPEVMAWTIPGWHRAMIGALLEGLPKAQRKALAPLDALADALATELVPFAAPLVTALDRAIYARTGERVPRDAWDLRARPAYLTLNYRVVDEHDKVLATGRELAELQRQLAARARELWAQAPRARLERKGLTTFDLDRLPETFTVDVGGRSLLAYPALVDGGHAVDVVLMESADAARAATRDGMRKLLVLAMGTSVAKLEASVPATLATGGLVVAGQSAHPRRQIVLRALDLAFRLDDDLPRTREAFGERLAQGRHQVSAQLAQLAKLATDLASEIERARALLKSIAGKPGPLKAAYDDMQAQLALLIAPELMRTTGLGRLGHLTRYVRAIGVRVQRLLNDPPKDQAKAAPLAPLVKDYLQRRGEYAARGRNLEDLDEFGWFLEELRVSVFAPELKTAVPVSLPRLKELWATIPR